MANPARGLLNRGKIFKRKSLADLPPHAARSEEKMKLQHKRARTTKTNKITNGQNMRELGSAGQNADVPFKKSCGGSKTSKTTDPERQMTMFSPKPFDCSGGLTAFRFFLNDMCWTISATLCFCLLSTCPLHVVVIVVVPHIQRIGSRQNYFTR